MSQRTLAIVCTILVLTVLLFAFWADDSFGANTPPAGSNGDIQYNNNGKYGPYKLGTGLVTTTSGGNTYLNSTASGGGGGTPGGTTPQLQYNAGVTFGGLQTETLAAYAAHDTVMNGIAYDPRNFGATCAGYNIFVSDGHTQTYNYTIPFTGSNSTDNSNFFVFTEATSGFDTATILATTDFSVTGVNSGSGTITLNPGVVPATGMLIVVVHDDSAGFVSASTAAVASGGYVSIPDNCTIYGSQANGTILADGAQLIGQSFTPNYTFQGTGTKPILNVISPSGFPPEEGFNIAGINQQFFEGFTITSHVPGYNSLGFLKVPVLIGGNGSIAGGGGTPGITAQYMTFNYGIVGFGSPIGGSSSYIFSTVRFSNFSANTVGIYGPLSDQIIVGNDFTSNGAFGSIGSSGGMVIGPIQNAPGDSGAARVEGNRFEFNREGVVMQAGGLTTFLDNQFDGNSACGLDLRGRWDLLNIVGGWFRGNGNGGGSFPGNSTAGQDAHICFNNTVSSGILTTSNVGFITNYGEGSTQPIGTPGATTPLYVMDFTTTGTLSEGINVNGGYAYTNGTSGGLGNNAAVTDFSIFRNGKPNSFTITNVLGQGNIGSTANGVFPAQARGLPSNSWSAFYAIGNVSIYGYDYAIGPTWPQIIGKNIGVAPTIFGNGQNTFNVYDCDLVNQQIAPNWTNIQTQDNPVVAWLPADYDPSYGAGFYQGHETDTNTCRLGGLTWLTVPASYRTYAQQGTTTGSGWTNSSVYGGVYGVQDSTNGDALAMTITTNGGPVYEWFLMNQNNGGTFSWQLDNTTTGSVAVQGQNAFTYPISSANTTLGAVRIPVTAGAGSHTVTSTITSTTTASNNVTILGLGTPPEIPYYGSSPAVYLGGQVLPTTNGPQPNAVVAFNADQKNQANQLFSDGLSVNFVDVQAYLKPTDYNNSTSQLYSSGMGNIASAFSAAMQFIPLAGNAVSPLDYGASCNTKAFTGNNFYGGGNYLVTTTTGSPVISIQNYKPDPNVATQNGGGDVGRVAVVTCGSDEGPTTYVLSATTTSLTLGENMAISCGGGAASVILLSGYPSDPHNPATAHDDTTAFTTAANAAVAGGGYLSVPNSCMIHDFRPPPYLTMMGNMGGNNYGNYWPPINSVGSSGAATTILYVGDTGFADDVDTATGVARDIGIDTGYGNNTAGLFLRISNIQINCPNFPYLGFQGMQGTAIGQKTRGAGTNPAHYDIGDEHVFLDHVAVVNCPTGLGPPLGWNHAVNFTATITGTTMTVASITSNGMSNYAAPTFVDAPTDFLAVGMTITGAGVTTGTTITSAPVGGVAGTYGLSLSSTVTATTNMSTVLPAILMSGKVRDSYFGQNGVGINGDMSDMTFENNVITGNYYTGFYEGPQTDGFGSSANRIFGGRFEENSPAMVIDTSYSTQISGVQFQANDCAIDLPHGWGDIQVTGGWFDGNGGCDSTNSEFLIGGNGVRFDISGASFSYATPNGPGHNVSYLIETATGSTADKISIQGGSPSFGYTIAPFEFTNQTPAHYKIDAPSISKVDTSQTILSSSSTGGVGIGTATPTNGTSLDLLSNTTTSNSSIGLPNHTTANQPTGITGMFGFNLTTTSPDFFGGGAWHYLPSTTTVAPAPGYNLQSTTTNGLNSQWVLAGTNAILGSTTTPSPSITGAATSGLYATSTTTIGVELAGNPIMSWTATASNTTLPLNFTTTPAQTVITDNGETFLSYATSAGRSFVTLGTGAFPTQTFAQRQVVIGTDAWHNATGGSDSIAIGADAGYGIAGSSSNNNIVLGTNALGGTSTSATANDNIIIGVNALASPYLAQYNVGIGTQSLQSVTTATNNVGIGYLSLSGVTTGSNNVAVGFEAGKAITVGSNNIAIGPLVWSVGTNYSGTHNILIDTTTFDPASTGTSNFLEIGGLYEGDTSISHPFINGTVPTISSGAGDFGTAPSIVGNDVVGKVVIGSSPGGQGTITFANPWTNAPDSCSCNNNTTTARGCSALAITTTSFALGATTSPFTGADQLGYECKSHRL